MLIFLLSINYGELLIRNQYTFIVLYCRYKTISISVLIVIALFDIISNYKYAWIRSDNFQYNIILFQDMEILKQNLLNLDIVKFRYI